MAKGGDVKMYVDHVLVKVAAVSDKALEAIALQIEGQTKVNIQKNGQIDTGFMLNSTYVVTKGGSTFSNANQSGTYTNQEGRTVKRQIVPQQTLPGNAAAAVAVGAQYAIYQEEKKPFLYPAAETVAAQAKGTAEKVFREGLND